MSVDPDVESGIKDLKINDKTDINVLLLGETGVGKSTLINSLSNYVTYKDFNVAKKEELLVLIPTEFITTDKNGEFHVIKAGERDSGVSSSTQGIKTYVFPIWNGQAKLRLIDTPGIGTTDGTDQDATNSENILRYVGQLNVLHAIFFVLKPNQASSMAVFRYCMSHILSQLDKSVSKNIIFIFTNTRGTDYGPGDMINLLKNEIDSIRSSQQELDIPINRNIFCFDNEPFRFLAAIKNDIEFDEAIEERNSESWKNSLEQCWKLITYMVGGQKQQPLKPHHVKSASAINEARRMINQLLLPLSDISLLISNNLTALERHEAQMRLDNQSLEQLKNKMYIPIIKLDIIEHKHPVVVCTSRTCAELYSVGGNNRWLYKQCSNPSHLKMVPNEMIGVPALVDASAVEAHNCPNCGCDFKIHMHVYYLSKAKEEVDRDISKIAISSDELVDNMKQILKSINERKEELQAEHKSIITACAKFALFLQNNAITPFSDYFKEYIEYLVNREKALGKICDQQTVTYLEKFLKEYEETRSAFEEVLRLNQKIGRDDLSVTPKDINETIQLLNKLKHNGKTIKALYVCQKKARSHEHLSSEYVQKIVYKTDEKQGAKKKLNKKGGGDEKIEKNEKNDKKDKDARNSDLKTGNELNGSNDKGKKKAKGNNDQNSKEKENMKKEKDKKVLENKGNKNEIDADKGKKEQGGKANKKDKGDNTKGKDKKVDLQKGSKKGKDDEKKEKNSYNKNKLDGSDKNRQQIRTQAQGATSKNKLQRSGEDAPPSYDEIHQGPSRPQYHPPAGPRPPFGVHGPPHSAGPYGPARPTGPYGPARPTGPYGPPPHGSPYSPPPPPGAYGPSPPLPGAYGPPPPSSPYGAPPNADPYSYGHDYGHSSEPPRDDRPTYNISIKLDKQEDRSAPRPPRDPYQPPPYVPPPVHGPQYYPHPHGAHGGPPAAYPYGNAPYDLHHGVHHHQHLPNEASQANTSRKGNDRGRGGQRGRGKGRGGINKKTTGKKTNKKSEVKGSDSESDDSDDYVLA